MRVLAIDTSTEIGSVAVRVDGVLRVDEGAPPRTHHGEVLFGHIASVLDAAKIGLGDIDLFAVGIGPGSFTGVRIGLATAKGLAFAQGKPLVGVPSIDAMGAAVPAPAFSVVAMDAFKGEVFAAVYRREGDECAALLAPFHGTPDGARSRIAEALRDGSSAVRSSYCGAGIRKYPNLVPEGAITLATEFDAPRAGIVATLAEARFGTEGPSDIHTLEPLYIRGSDATLPSIPLKTD
ncbi:MAG: tRNA (adenosine(37)-N6)-threonylcarbamoyltransferase complex dimerization subunit type 1 TsaB [Myxococcales bacterium]|nr:tRNA (adenosine(37)-N6)-threonylcarbamoyltransferase complex dimerization subunit type 1 TsaB [Myxococcales bacterium]